MRSDWMPGRRGDQLEMAKTWVIAFAENSSTNSAWDVSPAETVELAALAGSAQAALSAAAGGKGGAAANALAREAFGAMTRFMRFLHRRRFFSPPMTEADWLKLGLRPRDGVRTSRFDVNELLEFGIRLRGIRELLVDFRVKGRAHKAKPERCTGAVIVWDALDAPPPEPERLTRHALASRTPHALEFTDEERGKTVYIAGAWQNERGVTGAWSAVKSAIVP